MDVTPNSQDPLGAVPVITPGYTYRTMTDKLVGISCYDSLDAALAAQAGGADYVAFGSFFPSQVKPNAVHTPVDLLARARQALSAPIVAIGGITAENGADLVRAGADALAVISAVFAADDIERAARAFTTLFKRSDEE